MSGPSAAFYWLVSDFKMDILVNHFFSFLPYVEVVPAYCRKCGKIQKTIKEQKQQQEQEQQKKRQNQGHQSPEMVAN